MKICSDYDSDCKDVIDPYACWLANNAFISDDGFFFPGTEQADGYCPFLKITDELRITEKEV